MFATLMLSLTLCDLGIVYLEEWNISLKFLSLNSPPAYKTACNSFDYSRDTIKYPTSKYHTLLNILHLLKEQLFIIYEYKKCSFLRLLKLLPSLERIKLYMKFCSLVFSILPLIMYMCMHFPFFTHAGLSDKSFLQLIAFSKFLVVFLLN